MKAKMEQYRPNREVLSSEMLDYGKKNFSNYLRHIVKEPVPHYVIGGQPELVDIFNTNLERFFTLKAPDSVPDEWKEKLARLVSLLGEDDQSRENEIDDEMLEIIDLMNYDIGVLRGVELGDEDIEVIVKDIYGAVYSYQSYQKLIQENNIEFSGFEKDSDCKDFPEQILIVFSKEFLDKCVISEIKDFSSIVVVNIMDNVFYLPLEEYKKWCREFPSLPDYKFRAESLATYNEAGYEFMPIPVITYSYYGEDPGEQEYLGQFSDEEKMRRYKFGSISHELGHSAYLYTLGFKKTKQWESIIDKIGHLTKYSGKYSSGIHDQKIHYDEEFAEAIRLYTTANTYLKNNYKEVYNFLKENYPEITPMND